MVAPFVLTRLPNVVVEAVAVVPAVIRDPVDMVSSALPGRRGHWLMMVLLAGGGGGYDQGGYRGKRRPSRLVTRPHFDARARLIPW